MKSKKSLFSLLAKQFKKNDVCIGTHGISDETYGRSSRIYLWNIMLNWGVNRDVMEKFLERNGFKINRRWYKGADATEVQVSYFKGWHWDV